MPDRDVMTIGDLISYQYAKIIAKSAFGVPDGREAKGRHYGLVKQTFGELGRRAKNCGGIWEGRLESSL